MNKTFFYYRVWRWHFFAGLIAIPVFMTLAITGIIYLFKPQLDPVVYADLLRVPPLEKTLLDSALIASAQKMYPTARLDYYIPQDQPNASAAVGFTGTDQKGFDVFVNPYTAEVLGMRDHDSYYQNVVKKIHGELLLGEYGDWIVELVSCWGLILIMTGLYLWWPGDKKIYGVWLPRLKDGSRVFWRDFHAVLGIYSSIFICFLIITGLPWAGFWGDKFAKVWARFPDQQFVNTPQSDILAGSLNQNEQIIPWAVESSKLPVSTINGRPQISIDAITQFAKDKKAPAGYKIAYPHDETGVFTVSAFPGDPKKEITIHIDQYSGKILADIGYEDYSPFAKAVEYGIALHQGQYFGWANQLLALLTCLALLAICVSGAIMWWKRKPAKGFGVPPEIAKHQKSPLVAWCIITVMALAFPLVGLSLIVIFALDSGIVYASKFKNNI